MRRNPLTVRRRYVVIFCAFFLFFLAPEYLKSYPQTATLADAFTWASERFMQGIASLAFFFAICASCLLACNAYRWVTGAPAAETVPAPTPAALEDGTATQLHDLAVLEAEVAGAEPPLSSSSAKSDDATWHTTIGGNVMMLVLSSVIFGYEFLTHEVVSLDKPLMENVGATLLYILRGWEVLFVGFVLFMAGAWIAKSRSAAAATPLPPDEVLFEGTLPDEEEEDAPAAKEYVEKEKA
jgi:hypothetical protein